MTRSHRQCGTFLRAGKVSIEALHKYTCAKAEMRTRPRPSGCAARWGQAQGAACTESYANAPTTERLCREVGQGTKCRLHGELCERAHDRATVPRGGGRHKVPPARRVMRTRPRPSGCAAKCVQAQGAACKAPSARGEKGEQYEYLFHKRFASGT